MKKILLCFAIICTLLIPQKLSAHGDEEFIKALAPYAYNGFISYQYEIGEKNNQAFDADFVLALFNGGYSKKEQLGSNAYLGLGLGTLFQVQYGYAYLSKSDLLRIRTDIPFTFLYSGDFKLWQILSVGLFYERQFKASSNSNQFGVNLGIGLTNAPRCRTNNVIKLRVKYVTINHISL